MEWGGVVGKQARCGGRVWGEAVRGLGLGCGGSRGWAGLDLAGQGRAGQGRAGQGRAGQGRGWGKVRVGGQGRV